MQECSAIKSGIFDIVLWGDIQGKNDYTFGWAKLQVPLISGVLYYL